MVLDDAYVEYIRDGLLPDSLALVRKHPNVVVLRTFSKAYGLAGLRIGYAVAHEDIVTALGKVYVPFTATSVSQAAAIACLDAADELLARTDAVVAERARVSAALRDAGFELPDSQANFVWLPLSPEDTDDFVDAAADNKLLVGAAPLSLGEAVEIALQHSPQALAARYNAEASQARGGQARSGWLPQLTSTTLARGDYSYQTGTAAGKETVSSFRYSSSLQLNQMIYDFGRTSGRIGAAEAGARASREDAEATRAQLALAAMTSFFTVLQNEALREVAYVNLEQQNRRLQQADSFFKIGTRPQIDVLIAKTAVANAQLQVVQMQGNVQIARTQLLSSLGLPEGEWAGWLNRPLVPMLPAPLPLETAATASNVPSTPAPLPDAVTVLPGIHVGSSPLLLGLLAEREDVPVMVFSGYAGWAPGQLEFELQQSSWLPGDMDAGLLFNTAPSDVWEGALRRMSLTPSMLVSGAVASA